MNYKKVLSTLKSIRGGSEKTDLNMQFNTDDALSTVNAAQRSIRQAREEFGQEWEITPHKPEKNREMIDLPEITNRYTYEELPEAYIDEPEIREVREIVEDIPSPDESALLSRGIASRASNDGLNDPIPKTLESSSVMNVDTSSDTRADRSLDDEIARLLEADSAIIHDLPSFENVVPAKVATKEVSVFDRERKPNHEAVIGRQAEKLEELDKKKVRPRI